jgi:Tfp pilus assembly protein PilN
VGGWLVSQVNLLPPEILAAQRQRRLAGVVALAGVGLIGLILVFYVLQLGKVGGIRSDIDQQKQTNQGLQTEIQKLREFEQLRARAQAKQKLLNDVFANEISFSGLLMDVSRVIPSTAALTSMSATSQEPAPTTGGSTLLTGRIDIAGLALDYDTIASWLTRLERVRGWVNPWVTSIADPQTGPITYSSGVDLTTAALTERGQRAGGVADAG